MSQSLNEFAHSVGLRLIRTNGAGHTTVEDQDYALAVSAVEKAVKSALALSGQSQLFSGVDDTLDGVTREFWNGEWRNVPHIQWVPKAEPLVIAEPISLPLITLSPEGTTVNIPGNWSMTQVSEFFAWLKTLNVSPTEPSDSEKKSERIIVALLDQLGGQAYILDGELEPNGVHFESTPEFSGYRLSLAYS